MTDDAMSPLRRRMIEDMDAGERLFKRRGRSIETTLRLIGNWRQNRVADKS